MQLLPPIPSHESVMIHYFCINLPLSNPSSYILTHILSCTPLSKPVYHPASSTSHIYMPKRGVHCLSTFSLQRKSTNCAAHNLIALWQNPTHISVVHELSWNSLEVLLEAEMCKAFSLKVSITPDYCSCFVALGLKKICRAASGFNAVEKSKVEIHL